MVPTVCTEKKNASQNDPCRALAMPPVIRKTQAKKTFTARTSAAMAAIVTHQGERKSVWYRSPHRSSGALTTSTPESGSGCCLAIAPASRGARRAQQNCLLLHVVFDVVLGVPRLVLGGAGGLLRVTLGLVRPAVGMELVLDGVGRVLARVLDVVLHVVGLVGESRRGHGE